jgi:hypothetical protein
VISQEVNAGLCKDFIDEEISNAMFQIGPLKAPGLDGFPAHFFSAIGITAVKNFFITEVMPSGVNDTVIVLLPKKDEPEELKDFRSISLCNVVYKVVSKCLVTDCALCYRI